MQYHEITGALASRRPFALARYGDGEVMCMSGAKGSNADHHRFFGSLGASLRRTVEKPNPKITYALQNLVKRTRTLYSRTLYSVLKGYSKVEEWADADVLHRQSWHRSIDAFLMRLQERTTGLVGPSRLAPLGPQKDGLTKMAMLHVEIKQRDCWLNYSGTLRRIKEAHEPGMVWCLSAGMMAPVLIYALVDKLEDATLIDTGSLFDPYVGYSTRAYHKDVLKRLKAKR